MLELPTPEDDGQIIPLVGEWAHDKHHFLRRYIDAFTTSMCGMKPKRSSGAAFRRGSLMINKPSTSVPLKPDLDNLRQRFKDAAGSFACACPEYNLNPSQLNTARS